MSDEDRRARRAWRTVAANLGLPRSFQRRGDVWRRESGGLVSQLMLEPLPNTTDELLVYQIRADLGLRGLSVIDKRRGVWALRAYGGDLPPRRDTRVNASDADEHALIEGFESRARPLLSLLERWLSVQEVLTALLEDEVAADLAAVSPWQSDTKRFALAAGWAKALADDDAYATALTNLHRVESRPGQLKYELAALDSVRWGCAS